MRGPEHKDTAVALSTTTDKDSTLQAILKQLEALTHAIAKLQPLSSQEEQKQEEQLQNDKAAGICFYHRQGTCSKGIHCKYKHPTQATVTTVDDGASFSFALTTTSAPTEVIDLPVNGNDPRAVLA